MVEGFFAAGAQAHGVPVEESFAQAVGAGLQLQNLDALLAVAGVDPEKVAGKLRRRRAAFPLGDQFPFVSGPAADLPGPAYSPRALLMRSRISPHSLIAPRSSGRSTGLPAFPL